MITAAQMFNITKNHVDMSMTKELCEKIEPLMMAAAKKGHYQCYISFTKGEYIPYGTFRYYVHLPIEDQRFYFDDYKKAKDLLQWCARVFRNQGYKVTIDDDTSALCINWLDGGNI